jgi:hypothetical protein
LKTKHLPLWRFSTKTGYALPNDEKERDRLDLNHHLIFKALGDRIYLAPLEPEKIHRILDIGTGTGICKCCTVGPHLTWKSFIAEADGVEKRGNRDG